MPFGGEPETVELVTLPVSVISKFLFDVPGKTGVALKATVALGSAEPPQEVLTTQGKVKGNGPEEVMPGPETVRK